MPKIDNQEILFRAITHKPQDCIDCELAVVVDNPDPEEYEDRQIRICPVMHRRADEIDMKDCPLPIPVDWKITGVEKDTIVTATCEKRQIAQALRGSAKETGPGEYVKVSYELALMIADALEE